MLETKDREWVVERVEHYRREYKVTGTITVGPLDHDRDLIMISSEAGRPDTIIFGDVHFLPGQLKHTEQMVANWIKAQRGRQ